MLGDDIYMVTVSAARLLTVCVCVCVSPIINTHRRVPVHSLTSLDSSAAERRLLPVHRLRRIDLNRKFRGLAETSPSFHPPDDSFKLEFHIRITTKMQQPTSDGLS